MSARWPWFRMYSEARNDSKLDALNDREHRIWFKLLCLAADSDPRGEVDYIDPEFVAMELRIGVDELDSAISRMVRLRLVERSEATITFPAFPSRQRVKPSETPDATRERKRLQRLRAQAGGVTSRDKGVTARDVTTMRREERENIVGPVETVETVDNLQSLGDIIAGLQQRASS